jgi:hypothetical protein
MATVIDQLVVEFSLDPRKFTEAQRQLLDAFKKSQDRADEFSKRIDAQGMKMTEIFSTLKKGIMGTIGAFGGYEAMAIINHLNNMDAATGRWAKTIGTNVQNLSTWQGMIRQVGGSAEEAMATMSALQGAINNVVVGNGMVDNKFGFLLNQIGGLQGKNADQILRQLQAYFTEQISAGRMSPSMAATEMSWIPGMNQNMINVMLSDLKKLEEAARAAGLATKQSADEAIRYQESLNKLSLSAEGLERVLTIKLTPSLTTFLDRTKQIIQELSQGKFISPDSWLGNFLRTHRPHYVGRGAHRDPASDIPTSPTTRHYGRGAQGTPPSELPATTAPAATAPAPSPDESNAPGVRSTAADREAWIRNFAGMLGIDPDTALRVSRSEGFGNFKSSIPGEQSFGDFQLHITPNGKGNAVGDEFLKQTGLDPTDPANEKAMDMFALKWAAAHGWGDFHGAANTGIGTWQGIGARGAAATRGGGGRQSSNTTSTEVNIGSIVVNAPNATDADGIAREIGPAMKRSAITSPANSGLV